MNNVVTMALVGCGNIARAHWRGIRYHAPRIRVTAVVDEDSVRAEAMAERTGAEPFSSLTAALAAGGFDAVDLMLPHDLHEQAALECFAAGKHVVLEKPMATDVAACERILAAAREAGTVFMVAEQAQYWPDIARARELLDAGAIGEVLAARACFYDALAWDASQPPPWRFDLARSGGGIAIDGGAHWIRPLRMMLGEIDEVLAVTGRHIGAMQGESWAQALLRFQSGVVASFHALLHRGARGADGGFSRNRRCRRNRHRARPGRAAHAVQRRTSARLGGDARVPGQSRQLRCRTARFQLGRVGGQAARRRARVFPRRAANGARHVPFGGKPALGGGVAIGASHKMPRGRAHSNFVIRTEP